MQLKFVRETRVIFASQTLTDEHVNYIPMNSQIEYMMTFYLMWF